VWRAIVEWVIRSYADKDTERLADRERVRRFVSFEQPARIKLAILDAAGSLRDLSSTPGLRLEKHPQRGGAYSIRINKQWRIVFDWVDGDAENVTIVDYH
jgi:proteic killer suppression protein